METIKLSEKPYKMSGGVIYTRIASYLEGETITAAILIAFCAINGTGISTDSFGPIRLQYPPPPPSLIRNNI